MENAASVSRTETNEVSILRHYTLLRVTREFFFTHLSFTLGKEEVKKWKSQIIVKLSTPELPMRILAYLPYQQWPQQF